MSIILKCILFWGIFYFYFILCNPVLVFNRLGPESCFKLAKDFYFVIPSDEQLLLWLHVESCCTLLVFLICVKFMEPALGFQHFLSSYSSLNLVLNKLGFSLLD